MSTKVIPAQNVTTCDACGVVCTPATSRYGAALQLKRLGLDHQGSIVGDASFHADLCDKCLYVVEKALGTVLKGLYA